MASCSEFIWNSFIDVFRISLRTAPRDYFNDPFRFFPGFFNELIPRLHQGYLKGSFWISEILLDVFPGLSSKIPSGNSSLIFFRFSSVILLAIHSEIVARILPSPLGITSWIPLEFLHKFLPRYLKGSRWRFLLDPYRDFFRNFFYDSFIDSSRVSFKKLSRHFSVFRLRSF